MHCPRCMHDASKVLESRTSEAGTAIRRRRECLTCEFRFTTYERVEQAPLWVVKHDGNSEPFDRAKLLRGIARACSKRDIARERLEALVIEIEAALRNGGTRSVESGDIGALTLERLYEIDAVAGVRFASVYRAFEDLDEFRAELDEVLARHVRGVARQRGDAVAAAPPSSRA